VAVLALALLALWLAPGSASAEPTAPAGSLDTQADAVPPAAPSDPVETPADEVPPAVPSDPVETPADEVPPALPTDPVDTPADEAPPDPGETLPLDPSMGGLVSPAEGSSDGAAPPALPGPPPSSPPPSELTDFPSPVGPPRPVSSPPGGAAPGDPAAPLGQAAWFGDAAGVAHAVSPTLPALPPAAMGDVQPAAGTPAEPRSGGGPAPEPPRSPQAPGGPSVGGGSSSGGFSSGIFFAALIALMGLAAPRMSRLCESAARLRPQAYFVLLERPG
jgi:hypothetical protein